MSGETKSKELEAVSGSFREDCAVDGSRVLGSVCRIRSEGGFSRFGFRYLRGAVGVRLSSGGLRCCYAFSFCGAFLCRISHISAELGGFLVLLCEDFGLIFIIRCFIDLENAEGGKKDDFIKCREFLRLNPCSFLGFYAGTGAGLKMRELLILL